MVTKVTLFSSQLFRELVLTRLLIRELPTRVTTHSLVKLLLTHFHLISQVLLLLKMLIILRVK